MRYPAENENGGNVEIMKRKYKICILILFSVILLTACNGEKTERENDTVQNNESTVEKENELPEYDFAIKEYAEVQPAEVTKISVMDYLPDRDMVLSYTAENSGETTIYQMTRSDDRVEYKSFDPLFGEVDGSYYYYSEEKTDCLMETSTIPGTEDGIYFLPIGTQLDIRDDITLKTPPYLFTVTISAGTYEDCVCVLKEDTSSDRKVTLATYYAKGVGKVLSVADITGEFAVYEVLSGIETGAIETPVQSDVTDDKTDLKHEWWKDKAFQSADSGLYFWIEKEDDEFWFMVDSEYLNDQNCLVIGNVPTSAVQVGTDDTEGYIQYRFSDTVLQSTTSVCYFYNEDKVILLSKSDLNGQWLNESDTYMAVNGNSGIESKSTENRINHFFDGQSFECFETNSGEDMILTIYLFYDSDENGNMISDMPSMYKGTLSNGMEFWFEPYENSQDSETYIINCDDGSAAYLEYITNMSEINLLAESGMLCDYGGTYIGLPDSED